jgi:hypothetical protein
LRDVDVIHVSDCADAAVQAVARGGTWRYESGMKNVAKVAVSIPVETLKSFEKARTRLRKTRSAAVTEAIQQWLRAEEVSESDRLYVEGYLRQPEQPSEAASSAKAAIATWEPWE